jgi:hypothetical protein
MELSQGTSLYSYIQQTKLSIYLFMLAKSENRRTEQVLSHGLVPLRGRGCVERVKEYEYGANTMYTCMWMEKWNYPKNGKEEIKENDGEGVKFKYDVFETV